MLGGGGVQPGFTIVYQSLILPWYLEKSTLLSCFVAWQLSVMFTIEYLLNGSVQIKDVCILGSMESVTFI